MHLMNQLYRKQMWVSASISQMIEYHFISILIENLASGGINLYVA